MYSRVPSPSRSFSSRHRNPELTQDKCYRGGELDRAFGIYQFLQPAFDSAPSLRYRRCQFK
jgi:hypothetical protein